MSSDGGRSGRWAIVLTSAAAAVAVVALASRAADPGWPPDHVVVNEVVATNGSSLLDEDGDASDWIELYNPTDEPRGLGGLRLTDDPDRPGWQLPDVQLAPGDHLVVFASGKDREEGELHTDFRLAAAGEPVLLRDQAGDVLDRLPAAELTRDVSFGRHPDAPWQTCYFAFPSPGEANRGECFEDLTLGRPRFSVPSGFHDEPVELTIDPAHEDATVYYTLDGSYPDPEGNPGATRVLDGPLVLDGIFDDTPPLASIRLWTRPQLPWLRPDPDDVPRVHVVRARTAGSRERAATYLVGGEHRRGGLPVVSLLTDPEHLFDPDTGIYVHGRAAEGTADEVADDVGDEAGEGAEEPAEPNFWLRGREWERPPADELRRAIVFEWCEADGGCPYQREVGVRIHGGRSRNQPFRSLRLYARQDYGGRSFAHPLFGADAPVGHRRVLLRNSGQDIAQTMLLDGFVQQLVDHLQFDTQAYRPVVVYLNGEYWGVHNLRERYDRHYFELVHDVAPEELVLLDAGLTVVAGPEDGAAPKRALLDALADAPPGDPDLAARVAAEIDVANLVDYLAVQLFAANTDWPGANTRSWRSTRSPVSGGVHDGRWRWLLHDLDHLGDGLGRWGPGHGTALVKDDQHPTLAYVLGEITDDPTRRDGLPLLTRWLVDDPDAGERFLNRTADLLNTALSPTRTVAELGALEEQLAEEMARHVARWGYPASIEDWRGHVDELRRFLRVRPDAFRAHLADVFDLEGVVDVRVVVDRPGTGSVRVNSLVLGGDLPGVGDPDDWHGRYFRGVPVEVEARPAPGHRFVRWEGAPGGHHDQAVLRSSFEQDVELRAIFAPA